MLVERNLKTMNVAIVGDAYAIAAYYLRRSSQIPDTSKTNDRLLDTIIKMVHCGETHKIRIANKAIATFEADPKPDMAADADCKVSEGR